MFIESSIALYDFYKGTITGLECIKRISQSVIANASSLGGGLCGSILGASIGGIFGHIGLIIGSIGGSLFGTFINQKFWDYVEGGKEELARKHLLQEARKNLGVTEKSSFDDVISAWKILIIQFHPDKHPYATNEEKLNFRNKFASYHESFCLLRKEYEKYGIRTTTHELNKKKLV